MILPNGVETIEAFRICPHGLGIAYQAHLESTGPAAVEALLSAAERRGAILDAAQTLDAARDFVKAGMSTCHVLDLVNGDGDILDDRLIPVHAWVWWSAAAGLKPVSADCPACESAGYQEAYPIVRYRHPREG